MHNRSGKIGRSIIFIKKTWEGNGASICFEHCLSLENAGLLFLLLTLIANELLSCKSYYLELEGVYYTLNFTVLMLSFMFLALIKNPEQLKHINSANFGKLLVSYFRNWCFFWHKLQKSRHKKQIKNKYKYLKNK